MLGAILCCQALAFRNLCGGNRAGLDQTVNAFSTKNLSLLGAERKPEESLVDISRDTITRRIEPAQIRLRTGMPLIRRRPVESHRFIPILWNPEAIFVKSREVVLSIGVTIFRSSAKPPGSEPVVPLHAALAKVVHPPQDKLSPHHSLFRGGDVPMPGLLRIPPDPFPIGEERCEIELTDGITSFGCFAKPFNGLCLVFRNAESAGVQSSQICLCEDVPLIGGLAVEIRRLGVVLSHALPFGISLSEVELGLGFTRVRRRRQLRHIHVFSARSG